MIGSYLTVPGHAQTRNERQYELWWPDRKEPKSVNSQTKRGEKEKELSEKKIVIIIITIIRGSSES
jgi:hypothetical protein